MKVTESTSLFADALVTMNAAIEANKDVIPYRYIFEASKRFNVGITMGVAVYKDDPNTPHDYYTVRYQNGRVDLICHGKSDDIDITWKVSEDYLNRLQDDPDRYIRNPSLMDWDWLRSRLGV